MGQTSVGHLHGRLDVLQTSFVAPPSRIQDGGAVNDVNQDLGRVFRSLLRGRCKMATLPLPAAILDDLICGTGNEVIQDGRRKRKGRHFAPPPQWGSKNSPYSTSMAANDLAIYHWRHYGNLDCCQCFVDIDITKVFTCVWSLSDCMYQCFVNAFTCRCRRIEHEQRNEFNRNFLGQMYYIKRVHAINK